MEERRNSEPNNTQSCEKLNSETLEDEAETEKSNKSRLTEGLQIFWGRVCKFNTDLYKSDRALFMMQLSLTVFLSGTAALLTGYWLGHDPALKDLKYCTNPNFDAEKCPIRYHIKRDENAEEQVIPFVKNDSPPIEDFQKLKEDVSNQTEYLDRCLDENSELKNRQTSLEARLNITTTDISKVNYLFGLLNNNALDKETGVVVILCLLVGEVLIGMTIACYILPHLRRSGAGGSFLGDDNRTLVSPLSDNSRAILDKVNNQQPLQKEICLISFYSRTQGEHRKLLNSILTNRDHDGIAIHPFLVERHTDIPHTPPSKMYLIVVDFNERNIILETPGKGLGDLKLTTVRAAMKMGGEVIIVYDAKQSIDQNGSLYDTGLTSIKRIDELGRLEAKNCVLSIGKKFTEHQKAHLQQKIKSVFG